MKVFMFLVYISCSVGGVLLTRYGAIIQNMEHSINIMGIVINRFSLMGMVCYGFSFLLWMYLLQHNNLTAIVPISLTLANILTTVGAIYFFGETITTIKLMGIVVAIIGVALMNVVI